MKQTKCEALGCGSVTKELFERGSLWVCAKCAGIQEKKYQKDRDTTKKKISYGMDPKKIPASSGYIIGRN